MNLERPQIIPLFSNSYTTTIKKVYFINNMSIYVLNEKSAINKVISIKNEFNEFENVYILIQI